MEQMKKKKKGWVIGVILVILACIGVAYFVMGGKKDMTTEEFEEKLKEFSDGKIALQEPTVVGQGDDALYFANWNGFKISAKVKNDKLKMPIDVASPTVDKINEQTAADFQLLATSIIRITNSTLSKKESENVLLNELHFKEKLQDDQKYTYTKDELNYKLYGGKTEDDWYWFTVDSDENE